MVNNLGEIVKSDPIWWYNKINSKIKSKSLYVKKWSYMSGNKVKENIGEYFFFG